MISISHLPPVRAWGLWYRRNARAGLATMLVTALNPVLVLGAMGLGLGSLVNNGAGANTLDGVDYITFLAPGMLAAFAMQGAAGESMWPVLGGIKWDGTYLAMIATPLRAIDVLRGQLLWTMSRISLGSVMTFMAMVAFGAVESWWGVLAVPAAMLTGLAYAAPITAFAATQQNDTAFPLIFRFGVIPSYLFSGTFFPVSQLPSALATLARVTPLYQGVALCRSLTLGTAEILPSLGHVAYLLVFIALSLELAERTFNKRLYQ